MSTRNCKNQEDCKACVTYGTGNATLDAIIGPKCTWCKGYSEDTVNGGQQGSSTCIAFENTSDKCNYHAYEDPGDAYHTESSCPDEEDGVKNKILIVVFILVLCISLIAFIKCCNRLCYLVIVESEDETTTTTSSIHVNGIELRNNPATAAGTVPRKTEFFEQLKEIYQIYNPSKIESIPKILDKFKGRERVLFEQLHLKYNIGHDNKNLRHQPQSSSSGFGQHQQSPSFFPQKKQQQQQQQFMYNQNGTQPCYVNAVPVQATAYNQNQSFSVPMVQAQVYFQPQTQPNTPPQGPPPSYAYSQEHERNEK
jgi:hypothetical protein